MRASSEMKDIPSAEEVPLLFLAFLLGDDDRRDNFMATSGLAADELRTRLEDEHFKAFLLDYALSDEHLITSFAEQHDLDPHIILKARRKFPGAEFET